MIEEDSDKEEGETPENIRFSEQEAITAKRVIAYEVSCFMQKNHLSKTDMSRRMHTSRSALDRLLDPKNPSVTLQTLDRAARALGKRLSLELLNGEGRE